MPTNTDDFFTRLPPQPVTSSLDGRSLLTSVQRTTTTSSSATSSSCISHIKDQDHAVVTFPASVQGQPSNVTVARASPEVQFPPDPPKTFRMYREMNRRCGRFDQSPSSPPTSSAGMVLGPTPQPKYRSLPVSLWNSPVPGGVQREMESFFSRSSSSEVDDDAIDLRSSFRGPPVQPLGWTSMPPTMVCSDSSHSRWPLTARLPRERTNPPGGPARDAGEGRRSSEELDRRIPLTARLVSNQCEPPSAFILRNASDTSVLSTKDDPSVDGRGIEAAEDLKLALQTAEVKEERCSVASSGTSSSYFRRRISVRCRSNGSLKAPLTEKIDHRAIELFKRLIRRQKQAVISQFQTFEWPIFAPVQRVYLDWVRPNMSNYKKSWQELFCYNPRPYFHAKYVSETRRLKVFLRTPSSDAGSDLPAPPPPFPPIDALHLNTGIEVVTSLAAVEKAMPAESVGEARKEDTQHHRQAAFYECLIANWEDKAQCGQDLTRVTVEDPASGGPFTAFLTSPIDPHERTTAAEIQVETTPPPHLHPPQQSKFDRLVEGTARSRKRLPSGSLPRHFPPHLPQVEDGIPGWSSPGAAVSSPEPVASPSAVEPPEADDGVDVVLFVLFGGKDQLGLEWLPTAWKILRYASECPPCELLFDWRDAVSKGVRSSQRLTRASPRLTPEELLRRAAATRRQFAAMDSTTSGENWPTPTGSLSEISSDTPASTKEKSQQAEATSDKLHVLKFHRKEYLFQTAGELPAETPGVDDSEAAALNLVFSGVTDTHGENGLLESLSGVLSWSAPSAYNSVQSETVCPTLIQRHFPSSSPFLSKLWFSRPSNCHCTVAALRAELGRRARLRLGKPSGFTIETAVRPSGDSASIPASTVSSSPPSGTSGVCPCRSCLALSAAYNRLLIRNELCLFDPLVYPENDSDEAPSDGPCETHLFNEMEGNCRCERRSVRIAFLMLDYPGYGFSTGHPNPKSIKRYAEELIPRAIDELVQHTAEATGIATGRVRVRLRLVAFSLGCSVALEYLATTAEQFCSHLVPKDRHATSADTPWYLLPESAGGLCGGVSIEAVNLLAPFRSTPRTARHLISTHGGPIVSFLGRLAPYFLSDEVRWNNDKAMVRLMTALHNIHHSTASSKDGGLATEGPLTPFTGLQIKILHGDRDQVVDPGEGFRLAAGAERLRVAAGIADVDVLFQSFATADHCSFFYGQNEMQAIETLIAPARLYPVSTLTAGHLYRREFEALRMLTLKKWAQKDPRADKMASSGRGWVFRQSDSFSGDPNGHIARADSG